MSLAEKEELRLTVTIGSVRLEVLVLGRTDHELRLEVDGVQHAFQISQEAEMFFVSLGKEDVVLHRMSRFPVSANEADLGVANAPMPGQVLKILVEKGEHVVAGQALVILEAMKMEQTIRAAVSGIVEAILVQTGGVVSPGELLVRVFSSECSVGSNS